VGGLGIGVSGRFGRPSLGFQKVRGDSCQHGIKEAADFRPRGWLVPHLIFVDYVNSSTSEKSVTAKESTRSQGLGLISVQVAFPWAT
jgi:hypothetical protein